MCETLGEQVSEENIPIEYNDLPIQVQQALLVYNFLQDNWDGFNGLYMGKNLVGIREIFDLCEIEHEDRIFTVNIIKIIDKTRSDIINTKPDKKPAA
jgi:hypothetical protein